MAVQILRDDGQYRLISDANGRYAVVEYRGGKVYSVACHHRHGADDSDEGMLSVVTEDHEWAPEEKALAVFNMADRQEDYYARTIW